MGVRRTRWKFSGECKREAVAVLEAPGVRVHQIAADLGIGANVLGPVNLTFLNSLLSYTLIQYADT